MSIDSSLSRTVGFIEDGLRAGSGAPAPAGLHIGAQIYVSLNGRVLAEHAVGEARQAVAMRPDTLMLWLSAGKPFTAVAMAQLWERGRVDLDAPVMTYIPEFAQGGKGGITVRHLLTHTGGFRGSASNWTGDPWPALIARICRGAIEPGWIPGRKAGYHAASSWFVLGEIVHRVDGRPIDRYLREEILLPLGMRDTHLTLTPQEWVGLGERIGTMHGRIHGELRPMPWDAPAEAAMPRPGAGMRGPIRDLGRLYEMLLGGGTAGGRRILSAQSVAALTARQRTGMLDHTFKRTMDWGLGFLINSWQYDEGVAPYGYGPLASNRTFGHGGQQSSAAFADPETGLVVALVFNGMPGEVAHDQRLRPVVRAIYEDLGLDGRGL